MGEVNLAGLVKVQPLLMTLSKSTQIDQKLFERVIKTAAILDMTRGREGFGIVAPLVATVTPILAATRSTSGCYGGYLALCHDNCDWHCTQCRERN